MPDILPLRDYSEHFVLNYYTFSGTIPANKGTFVKVGGSGFVTDNINPSLLGNVGAAYNNVVSQRWGTQPYVQQAASGDNVIGMLLYDIREVDENGEKLIFHPQKAYENNWRLSGQTVPILTKGVVMYSGVVEAASSITAGAPAYISGGTVTPQAGLVTDRVGKFLGTKDAHGWVLLKVDV